MATMMRTLVSLAVTALLIEVAMGATIAVGGPNGGWDLSTNYQTWASSQTFTVGDTLVFGYTPMHSVLEVSKADYDSCSTTNPVLADTSGNTAINLTSPGKRYFICGTGGHCSQGMKLEVDTVAASTPPPTNPSIPPTPPPTNPAIPPTPSSTTPLARPPAVPSPSSGIPPSESPVAPSQFPSSLSPTSSSPMSPMVPSSELPSAGGTPVGSPLPGDSAQVPSPSAANGDSLMAEVAAGLGFGLVMILAI